MTYGKNFLVEAFELICANPPYDPEKRKTDINQAGTPKIEYRTPEKIIEYIMSDINTGITYYFDQ